MTIGTMMTTAAGTRMTIQRLPTDSEIGEALVRKWIGEGEKDLTAPKGVEKVDEREMLASSRRECPSGTRSHGASRGQHADPTVKAGGMDNEDPK
mmetsp:Transcript_71776/g.191428  ORF Transcript_71776/g.191428 Transcript_71776/m.191428 type:complete len:95 (+) Transcript_71776:245-529(+)